MPVEKYKGYELQILGPQLPTYPNAVCNIFKEGTLICIKTVDTLEQAKVFVDGEHYAKDLKEINSVL